MVVPDRFRHRVGAVLRGPLQLAVSFPGRYYWLILVPALAVGCLLQWGLAGPLASRRGPGPCACCDGLFYYRPGRPARIAMFVVSIAALGIEAFLIRRGLLVAAIVVAALAVAAEVAPQQAVLRGIRQDLRGGGGAA